MRSQPILSVGKSTPPRAAAMRLPKTFQKRVVNPSPFRLRSAIAIFLWPPPSIVILRQRLDVLNRRGQTVQFVANWPLLGAPRVVADASSSGVPSPSAPAA